MFTCNAEIMAQLEVEGLENRQINFMKSLSGTTSCTHKTIGAFHLGDIDKIRCVTFLRNVSDHKFNC